MIDVVEVRKAAYRMAKVGTSGYDPTPDFIPKANEAQGDLMNILTPYYGKIQAIDDMLDFLVVEATPTFTSGVMNKPNGYYGFISMWKTTAGKALPVGKLKTNQIGTNDQNSIRRATAAKPKYYFRNSSVILRPSNGDSGLSYMYFRKPTDISITTTPVETDEDDYETVTAKTDFEWPDRVKNLLIYLIVQRLGVEMKEPILYEVSQLGIKQNLTVQSAEK